MNQVVKRVNSGLPAVFQSASKEVYDEFSHGVTSGFPVISFRGRTWRVKKGGEEQVYLDANQEAVQSIEVVLVRSNPNLAKIFYDKKYEEGDNSSPRCWSPDGVKPDVGVQQPISKLCAACPNNVWGSKITENGTKTRACADHRRIAIAFRHDVEKAVADPNHTPTMLLLRVPPASLNPLKDFVEKTLQPKGIPPYAVFIRVGFDTDVSYPKLKFKGTQLLNEAQGQVVVKLRDADDTKRILAEAFEYSAAGTTDEATAENHAPETTGEATAPTKSAPAASSKMKPVEEEELNNESIETDDEIAPAMTTASDEEELAPAEPEPVKAAAPTKAATKAAKSKATKPAKVEAAPVIEPAEPAKAASDETQSFDAMLDSLLDD